jgi:GWxTD domain-containing protein
MFRTGSQRLPHPTISSAFSRRRASRGLAALALLFPFTAYPSPLTSQSTPVSLPAPATEFERLQDSLARSSDTAALRTLLRSSQRYHKSHKADLSAALRTGLVALRLGQLRADPDFSEALSSFRQATKRGSHRPEPWYALGLAEEGRSAWEMEEHLNLGSRVGMKALERAAAHHRRALTAEPRFTPAALSLARLALTLGDTARLTQSLPVLRKAAEASIADANVMLAYGRVERLAGRLDAAEAAFRHYLTLRSNRALGQLELARTLLASGSPDGEIAYYEGASLADVRTASEYRADLVPLVADSGVAHLVGLRGEPLALALAHFWNDRDRLEFRSQGERLREHYRRLQYARLHFPLTISRRFYGRLDAYRSGSMELDDRGIIYIRHGEPSVRLRPFVYGAMPNETWKYTRADGDLLLHFSSGFDHNGGGDLYDYRLVQSLLDIRGASDAPPDQLLLSRQSLSPAYARMLNWGRYGAAHARALERRIGAASIIFGTATDSYELQFQRRLGVVADLIAVGRNSRGRLAHFVFGIRADDAVATTVGGDVQYRVRAQIVATGRGDRPVASLDTTLLLRYPRALESGEFVVGRATLTLPRGRWGYRAVVQQGDSAGVILPRDSVDVAGTEGGELELSDLGLGVRDRSVRWITEAADTVLLAPSKIFRKGADLELYYEVAGATAGASYRHEITVLKAEVGRSGRRRSLVSLSFEEAAADSLIRSHRTVKLDRLKVGSYLVEVKVAGNDGAAEIRRRSIRIIEP